MTIDEAIKVLTDYMNGYDESEPVVFDEAIILGIEALKREKSNRDNPDFVMVGKLPGETEE